MKLKTVTCITRMILIASLATLVALEAEAQSAQEGAELRVERPQPYIVKDLGTLGGTFSEAEGGINDKEWVTGIANLPEDREQHTFLWREGVMTDLGTLGGPNSAAWFPLNERGQITGFAESSTPDPLGENFCGFGTEFVCLPFFWQDGLMRPLPTLGGNNGFATEINNRGQIVGGSENGTPDPTCLPPQVIQFRPVLWEKGKIRELPLFPGDSDGEALAINDSGEAVGDSGICGSGAGSIALHAVLWRNGTVTELGTLGGSRNNIAFDINNRGQVVGFSDLSGDTTGHAFLWTRDSGMRDLGSLPGGFSSLGNSINERGEVVGYSCDMKGNCRAFLWRNGVMTDLNTLLPADSPLYLVFALGINSRGEIGGGAVQKTTGEVHAFLATPCELDRTDTDGCQETADRTTSALKISDLPKVTIPENVRERLQQQLPFSRLRVRLTRAQ